MAIASATSPAAAMAIEVRLDLVLIESLLRK